MRSSTDYAQLHSDKTLDATSARRQIQQEARPVQVRGTRKRGAELHMEARRNLAIHRIHIHDGPAFHLPINEALAKGNPVNIGFLLRRIHDIG